MQALVVWGAILYLTPKKKKKSVISIIFSQEQPK
jgi:hypothetical protein